MSDKLEKDKNKHNIFLNQPKKSKTKNTDAQEMSSKANRSASQCQTQSKYQSNHFINKDTKETKETKNKTIDINNDELFPELNNQSYSLSSLSSLSLYKQKKKANKQNNIDFLSALQCSETIKREIYDDIDPGWVVMYFDENKQIRKEYGPSTGITEKLEKERIEKYKKEIHELFEEREREIQERIELFGDERLYKPELENYKEPEIYYGNESDCEENSFTDENGLGDIGYVDYQDDYL